MTETLLDCTERQNTVSTALRKKTSKICPLTFSTLMSFATAEPYYIIGHVLAFYRWFRVLLFSILVPYRDFKESLPQVTAQKCRIADYHP